VRHQKGRGGGVKISVGRIMRSGCMLMLKVVITGVNVDSGNTHVWTYGIRIPIIWAVAIESTLVRLNI
jgi:hypothetical protein